MTKIDEGHVLSVRIPAAMAEWLGKRELDTDVTTSRLIRRLIRMEMESIRDLKSEPERRTLESYYHPAVLVSPKAEE